MNCFRFIAIARLSAGKTRFCRLGRLCAVFVRLVVCVVLLTLIQILELANAQTADDDDSLRIYAVNVIKTPPFKKELIGYGIYLGQGIVITAGHVVGHWPFFTHPRVLVGGLDLPAKVLKNGLDEIDLALLAVDPTELPVSLRLRRNPLCHGTPMVGMQVINVVPEKTSRSRVISSLAIAPELRNKFDTLINDVEGSGSGIFDAQRKCLLGVASAEVVKYKNQMRAGHVTYAPAGFAGYFVSAAKITKFLPEELHP
jgi:hypothetical protein